MALHTVNNIMIRLEIGLWTSGGSDPILILCRCTGCKNFKKVKVFISFDQGCRSAFLFADPDPAVLLKADPDKAA